MDTVIAFFVSLAFLGAVCLVVVHFVRKPLLAILVELCGADHRARFWTNLYQASLILTVLFAALLWPPNFEQSDVGIGGLLGMFRLGLLGLLVSIFILAIVMGRWIFTFDRRAQRGVERSQASSS